MRIFTLYLRRFTQQNTLIQQVWSNTHSNSHYLSHKDVPTDYHQQIDNYATEMLPPPHLPPKSHYQTPVTHQSYSYQAPSIPLSQQNVLNHQQQQSISNHQPQLQNRQYQDQYYNKPKEEYYPYQDYPQDYQQKIGKIHDYDPVEDGPRAPLNTQRATSTVVYNSSNANEKRGMYLDVALITLVSGALTTAKSCLL